MKFRLPAIRALVFFSACQSSPQQIAEGYWTGTLTPMNHPDMSNPMGYEVSYSEGALSIDVIGPDSTVIPASSVLLENRYPLFSIQRTPKNR